jgi:hypothetical protein
MRLIEMIGDKIRRKIQEVKAVGKARELVTKFQEHKKLTYPYTREDDEGVATYISPRCVEMVFKGISPEEGYKRTINRFKLIGRIHKTRIELVEEKVVVNF